MTSEAAYRVEQVGTEEITANDLREEIAAIERAGGAWEAYILYTYDDEGYERREATVLHAPMEGRVGFEAGAQAAFYDVSPGGLAETIQLYLDSPEELVE